MDLDDFWKTLELKKKECVKLIEKDSDLSGHMPSPPSALVHTATETNGCYFSNNTVICLAYLSIANKCRPHSKIAFLLSIQILEGCRTTWDGIYCWPHSKPGELAYASCPEYISGFDLKENATKLCTNNGWWVRQDLNVTWTNYTGCYHDTPYLGLTPFDVQLQTSPMVKSYIPIVKLISQIGYGISLIALLLAFTILAFNKRLRCPRNLLHLHLFVSFIMRASMALLKDNLFVEGVGLRHNVFYLDGEVVFTFLYHKWECKFFTVLWQYFILANYSWILMEGIYLHNLTFMAMFYDTSSIFWHVTMGWTLPLAFVIPWAIVRAFYEDTFCWTTHTNKFYFYIIKTPIIVSNLVNLFLFINIIRVLLKKLNSTTALFLQPRISRYRKWAKSTLILMPLYGVHYALLLGMSYSDDPTVEIVWLISDQLFGSSQGFCVALLYCILNGEVMNEMSRKWYVLNLRFRKWYLRKSLLIRSKETVSLGETRIKQNQINNQILVFDESNSQDEDIMGLTGRLLDFAPGVTGEQLTEEQETALKKATIFFYKQLMLQQQNKTNQLPHISLVSSSSDMCRICREAGSKEDLLTTCGCKGTMRFIHLSCLEHWLAESDSTKCELCSFQYQTVRTPKYSIIKSIILWLQNPGRRRDAREIMLDFLALIVFTPMAFFGTYMALLATESWYSAEDNVLISPTLTRILSLGCLGVIGAIDTAYLSWLLLRAQHHARAWHRWRRRNSVVKVILSPPKSEENNNKEKEISSTQTSGSNS